MRSNTTVLRCLIAVSTLLSAAACRGAGPDTSLARFLGQLLRADFRAAGASDSIVWQPADQQSALFLRQMPLRSAERILSGHTDGPQCPARADPGEGGYTVR